MTIKEKYERLQKYTTGLFSRYVRVYKFLEKQMLEADKLAIKLSKVKKENESLRKIKTDSRKASRNSRTKR